MYKDTGNDITAHSNIDQNLVCAYNLFLKGKISLTILIAIWKEKLS